MWRTASVEYAHTEKPPELTKLHIAVLEAIGIEVALENSSASLFCFGQNLQTFRKVEEKCELNVRIKVVWIFFQSLVEIGKSLFWFSLATKVFGAFKAVG